MSGPWISFCSVNPKMGIEHKLHRMVPGPASAKKAAVIGGGPAGMEAAITAAERGHKVMLYEKSDHLGGQLIHAEYVSFKWPLRKYRNYMITQMYKLGVKVILNTQATPQLIEEEGFDSVLAATGAEPNLPDIPGINGENVWTCMNLFGNEKKLGKKVAVIGGSQMGVEIGMHLAETGHSVTVLTRQNRLASDASPLHSITMAYITVLDDGSELFEAAWERLDNFSYILNATTAGISEEKVTYRDPEGNLHDVETESVVICGGMNPRQDEALKFYGSAKSFALIGDCDSVGNIQRAVRSAYGAASQL